MAALKGNTLNEDQIKILALLAVGTAEEEIAEQLCIGTQAVRIEIDTIFKKINAPNLFQAVLWAALRLQGLRDLKGSLSTNLIEFILGARGIHMGRNITVILRDGTEFTYKNAKVVEGIKTWIYQVNKNERPEELLALIDPNHIRKLYTEED